MPKMKTNKSVKKRFTVSGKGTVKRKQANKGHLLGGKTRDRKRRLRQTTTVASNTEAASIKKMIPYDA